MAAADILERQHRPAVLANRLHFAERWNQPCLAYNACIRPGPSATAALSALQARVLRREPSLRRIPESALHASLVWLLPVQEEFGRRKDELWQRNGPGWVAALAGVAARTGSFRLSFRRLVATDSAIIALADEPNGVSALRRDLIPLLRLPGSASAGDLAHVTLFRYAEPLRDPGSLVGWLAAGEFCLEVDVGELLVIRERVFPSLRYDVLHRLPLLAAGPNSTDRRRPSSSDRRRPEQH
jgi:hypothetical protein